MRRLHSSAKHLVSSIDTVAVAICLTGDSPGRHLGLVHLENKQLRLLELRFHLELANEPWNPTGYFWIIPNLDPLRIRQVATAAREIARANGKHVPFGFSQPSDCFDAVTHKLLFGSSKYGFTCATLVLNVFHHAQLQLIDYESWEPRPEDIEWQKIMIGKLENQEKATQSEISARKEEVGCFRYRPEEVAAASAMFPPQVKFKDAMAFGERIVTKLKSQRGKKKGR